MKLTPFRWMIWAAIALALAGTWAWYFQYPVRWTLENLMAFCSA